MPKLVSAILRKNPNYHERRTFFVRNTGVGIRANGPSAQVLLAMFADKICFGLWGDDCRPLEILGMAIVLYQDLT
jgi:hypothetical protein